MFCETFQIMIADVSSQKLKKDDLKHKAVDAKNSMFLICHPSYQAIKLEVSKDLTASIHKKVNGKDDKNIACFLIFFIIIM